MWCVGGGIEFFLVYFVNYLGLVFENGWVDLGKEFDLIVVVNVGYYDIGGNGGDLF